MISNMIAATALLASAPLANALGHAIVKNACQYEVKMCNVPSSGGGFEEIDMMLQPNETYTQQYAELSNGNGWSLKLSPDENLDHILQYEYTTHSDGIIWYDLSQVDGNPWDGNWQITASEGCNPKQQAYRYATDDAYGMQSCDDDADITVTLCSGEDQNDAYASESSVSVPASSSVAGSASSAPASSASASYTSQASYGSASSSASASSTSQSSYFGGWGRNKNIEQATTLSTRASSTPTDNVVAVTHTVYQTIYARETAPARAHRRHSHNKN